MVGLLTHQEPLMQPPQSSFRSVMCGLKHSQPFYSSLPKQQAYRRAACSTTVEASLVGGCVNG